MKLSIPCNWDMELIEATKDLPVYDFYGAIATTPIGHGRPALIIPDVDENFVAEYIKKVHSTNRKFSYVLNATTMGNLEFDPKFHRTILKYLQWLVNIGVDAVHVSIPYLMEIIINQFPKLKVTTSVMAHTCSVDMAKEFERMGVSAINLSLEVNRDFKAIRAIRKAVKIPLILIPNLADLHQCPYRHYHYSILGYTSQTHNIDKARRYWAMQPCKMYCNERKLSEPLEILKSCFIRPEDLKFYEKEGIDVFKLSGRHQNTEWIMKVARAYANREYKGNLVDIIDAIIMNKKDIREFHPEFITESDPEIQAVPEFYSWSRLDLSASDVVNINNTRLNGFIDHFVNNGCNPSIDCDECGYCAKWVDKAVKINPDLSKQYLEAIKKHRNALLMSKFAKEVEELEWDKRVKAAFENTMSIIPLLFRKVAKTAISTNAEKLAKERGSSIVEEEDLAKAFRESVPSKFQGKMKEKLKSNGIDITKFRD